MKAVLIPAREGSTRLKNKMLLDICGKPLIRWTVENCLKLKDVKIIVATDSEKIKDTLKGLDVDVYLTPSELKSGSDRIAYVVKELPEIKKIVNVQGDEPFVNIEDIEKIFQALETAEVASLYFPISKEEDYLNPNVVKVVMDKEDFALYFSRSPVPFVRDESVEYLKNNNLVNKHIGVYGYQRKALLNFAYKYEPSPLELAEKLEQLRFLHYGVKIKMIKATSETVGVDTREDYEKVCSMLNQM